MRYAVFEISPEVTASDVDRLLGLLADHIDNYAGPDRNCRKLFTAWARQWLKVVTALYETTKAMAPAFEEAARAAVPGLSDNLYNVAAERVTNHIAELLSPDSLNLIEWGARWAVYEAEGLRLWPEWAGCEVNRRSVYRGLWKALKEGSGCSDLGLGRPENGGWHPTIEGLASDVWVWVSDNAGLIFKTQQPGVPIGARLKARAYFTAKSWKTSQLRVRRKFQQPTSNLDPWDIPLDYEFHNKSYPAAA